MTLLLNKDALPKHAGVKGAIQEAQGKGGVIDD
jgi:hypothetical protein